MDKDDFFSFGYIVANMNKFVLKVMADLLVPSSLTNFENFNVSVNFWKINHCL